MLPDHIRRIARYDIKRSSVKKPFCFLQISCHNINLFFEMVQLYTAPRHVGALLLNLDGTNLSRLRLCLNQNRDNPRARAQIKHRGARLHLREAAQQYRVHAKAEFLRILDNLITVAL